jgi:hypothetical protein
LHSLGGGRAMPCLLAALIGQDFGEGDVGQRLSERSWVYGRNPF